MRLTPDGDCQNPWIETANTGKHLVTKKPGEHIRFKGELQKGVYRALPLVPPQQPLAT